MRTASSRVDGSARRKGAQALWLRYLLWSILALALAAQAQDKPIELRIEGAGSSLEENIRAHVGSLQARDADAPARLRARLLDASQDALQALGYYEAEIDVRVLRETRPPEVELRVTAGEPVRWRNLDVQIQGDGRDDEVLQETLDQHLPKAGQTLNQGLYENLKRRLRVNAISRGYFDANFSENRLEIDRAGKTADAIIRFDTHQRYRLGEVSFSDTKLSRKRLDQLVQFTPDAPYNESRINQLNKRLLDSGYFASVTVRPRRTEDASHPIPVEVTLRDNEPNRVGVGVGYGTDSGGRFRLNWHKPLVTSGGHSLSSELTYAEQRRELTVEYRIPENDPIDDYWVLQGGYLQEIFEDNQYQLRTFGISRQTLLDSGWWRNPFIRIRSEQGFLKDDAGVKEQIDDPFYVVPGINFSKVKTEGGVHPSEGYRLQLETEFSDPLLGSDTRYFRVRTEGSYLYTIAPKHQWLNRLELGLIQTENFDEVPPSVRFFAGGDQSVRGYDYKSLSPERSDGTKTGGKFLTVASTEYLYRILENWQLALFVDHGGAFAECCTPRYTGAGVGARWLLPFGNVRVDVAKGLDDGGFQFHLFVGGVL